MKRTRTLLTTSTALLLLALLTHRPSGQAQEAKPEDPYKKGQPARDALVDVRDENVPAVVSFHFEIFSLALAEAGPLLREPLSDEERLQRVLKLMGEGKARQERLIIARTKSGQRMVVENISEFRYPTQWGLADFGTLDARQKNAAKDGGPVELKPGDPEVVFKDQISGIGVIATSIETRNTGDTIEIEPVIGPDGKTIDLNLVPQTVHYVGDRMIPGPNPIGQPVFETQKVTTSDYGGRRKTISPRDTKPALRHGLVEGRCRAPDLAGIHHPAPHDPSGKAIQ